MKKSNVNACVITSHPVGSEYFVSFPINHRNKYKIKLPLLVALLSASLIFSSSHAAYALSNPNDGSLQITQKTKFSDSKYRVMFSFCMNQNYKNILGIVVSSSLEKIPVVVDTKVPKGECRVYGTNIIASDPANITVSLFNKDDVKDLVSNTEAKISSLEDQRIKAYQELLRSEQTSSDAKKIDRMKKEIQKLDDRITSQKHSLKVLRSFK